MAKTRSMTRDQNHDDDASSSRTTPKTSAPWSDLNHDMLFIVMMKLGFGDYYSFRGVCMSWRSLAYSNVNKFMASIPPMSITISTNSNVKECCLEDFQGRKFNTVIPWFSGGGDCIGLTCGYLIFFAKQTRNFWLVNPTTNKQLHFPSFPMGYYPDKRNKAILVFSPSISGLVFVVLCEGDIRFSIVGKGAWKHVMYNVYMRDLYAISGKIYTLSNAYHHPVVHERCHIFELRLKPDPKFTLLETKNPLSSGFFIPKGFVGSAENVYVMDWSGKGLYELDTGEMKWVKPCEKTMEEYALFNSDLICVVVAVKRQSWADPRSRPQVKYALYPDTYKYAKFNVFSEKMWYFPHQCMNVDCIDE